jgi:short-subunit dehydrogenase
MNDKYVIITGAYGGLGKALAEVYATNGYGLVLLGRKKEALQNLKKEINTSIETHTVVCDVSDWRSCQDAYKTIKDKRIEINTLINNAGITYIQNFNKDYDIKKYQQLIDTNLNGSVYLTRLFIDDLLKNKGSVITISSVIGYAPVIGRTAYAASKFGLEGFFSVLRAETADKLHVMMVYPTFIATQIRADVKGDKTVNEVLTATEVAQKTYKAYQNKKNKVFIGKTAKLSYYLYKFLPNLYVNLMRKKVNQPT